MSISKGGQSVKPYVGSKEVKEAYVGSQLVYRATPPYLYFFLGRENDYILNSVDLRGNAIVKPDGSNIFNIANRYALTNDQYGYVDVTNLGQYVGRVITSIIKPYGGMANQQAKLCFRFYGAGSSIISQDFKYPKFGSDYTTYSYQIPNGALKLSIITMTASTSWLAYIDTIRLEPEL